MHISRISFWDISSVLHDMDFLRSCDLRTPLLKKRNPRDQEQGHLLQVCLLLVVCFSLYENYQLINTDRVRLNR